MFFGTECSHCHAMEPVVERLESELGIRIERLEIWHNDQNAELMEQYDSGFCGGVPFFYSEETREKICGEAPYDRLKAWAEGKAS